MRLFKHLPKLTLNPDNAARLKQLVLELAVRGKLTENWRQQNPDVEPSRVLLEQIRAEKNKLIKERKIKKEKPLPAISEDEKPYELPKEWEWCRWVDLLSFEKYSMKRGPFGSALRKDFFVKEGVRVFEQYNAINDDPYWARYFITREKYKELKAFTAKTGDILISCSGSLGKITEIPEDAEWGIINQALLKLNLQKGLVTNAYFKLLFKSEYMQQNIFGKAWGTAIANMVGVNELKKLLIPLPPLAEQKAIVKIVDELTQQINALTKQATKRIEVKKKLALSALHHLTQPEEGQDHQKHWRFVKDHFQLLFDEEDNIKKLRESILQLAVQGKLTENWRQQNPDAEPASVLLEQIKAEKDRLIKEKKIKKGKPLPAITEEEIPYELPEGWEWCRLGEITESFTNGLYKPAKYYTDKGIVSLRMYNIQEGSIDFRGLKKVELTQEEYNNYYLEESDILINRVNSAELIGKSAIIPKYKDCLVYESMNIRMRLHFKYQIAGYINLLLRTLYARDYMQSNAKHAIGQSSINQSVVSKFVVPFPPLTEQKAIVEKVNQLMKLCDTLEAQVKKAKEKEEHLMQALIQDVFVGKEEVPEVGQLCLDL